MNNLVIGEMTESQAKEIYELENELLGNADLDSILKTINNDVLKYYVLTIDGNVIGFLQGQCIPPEAEIYDIAIKKDYQGNGYSKFLLDYYITSVKNNGCNTIFLEVNKINYKAINLYSKFGFAEYSIRKNYYGNSDAILMKKELIWFYFNVKYLKFGDSKDFIVFLHGWGADKNSFLWTKNYFDDFSLVYVDFDGFGECPEPPFAYGVSDYALKLKELIDTFDAQTLTLVGHSFGGRVAIKFAFLYQNEYKNMQICLVDSAGLKPKRNLIKFLKIKKYKFLKRRALKNPKLLPKLKSMGSSDFKILSDKMKQTFVKVVNEDLASNAKFIKCRTCIIWGSKDTETKLYMAKKLNRLIKNSELHTIKGAGHYSFLDNPQEFLILLDTFVKN